MKRKHTIAVVIIICVFLTLVVVIRMTMKEGYGMDKAQMYSNIQNAEAGNSTYINSDPNCVPVANCLQACPQTSDPVGCGYQCAAMPENIQFKCIQDGSSTTTASDYQQILNQNGWETETAVPNNNNNNNNNHHSHHHHHHSHHNNLSY